MKENTDVLSLKMINKRYRNLSDVKTSSPKGNDRSPENKQVFLNSSLVSKRFFSIGQGQPTLQSMVDQILNSIKGCYSVANLQKMTL